MANGSSSTVQRLTGQRLWQWRGRIFVKLRQKVRIREGVEGIADNRVANGGKMNADLVGTSGLRPKLDKRGGGRCGQPLLHVVGGLRRLGIFRAVAAKAMHARQRWQAAYGQINAALPEQLLRRLVATQTAKHVRRTR